MKTLECLNACTALVPIISHSSAFTSSLHVGWSAELKTLGCLNAIHSATSQALAVRPDAAMFVPLKPCETNCTALVLIMKQQCIQPRHKPWLCILMLPCVHACCMRVSLYLIHSFPPAHAQEALSTRADATQLTSGGGFMAKQVCGCLRCQQPS